MHPDAVARAEATLTALTESDAPPSEAALIARLHLSRNLFAPAWGPYDMVVGARVTAVFGGTADRKLADS